MLIRYKINIPLMLLLIFVVKANILAQNEIAIERATIDNPEKIIASIDSIKITAEEFSYSYEFGPAFIKRMPDSKQKHLEYMINEKLLALYGYKNFIEKEEQVINSVNAFHYDLATEEMFKNKIQSRVEISEKEIDTVITQKRIDINIRWIYKESAEKITNIYRLLVSGKQFNNLFNESIKDSSEIGDRKLETTRFQLGKKNPLLASVVDTLSVNKYSAPIKTNDGYYIVYVDKLYMNPILTETEHIRLKEESISAIKKFKMDAYSNIYINELMKSKNPVIKSAPKRIVRSYLGKYILEKKKYRSWNLKAKLEKAVSELGVTGAEEINNTSLVELNGTAITIKEFLNWFWLRDNYIKFNKSDINNFSISLDNIIWRMTRDELLTREAFSNNYNNSERVQKELSWWKDKIISSAVKNKIRKSLNVNLDEQNNAGTKSKNELANEYSARLFRKISKLKKEFKIEIDKAELDKIKVSSENDKSAVELYTVKKGGLIPRTPSPTIDNDWVNWE